MNEERPNSAAGDSERRFSTPLTVALAFALLVFLTLLSSLRVDEMRIRNLERPFASALRVFERDLAIDDGLSRRAAWIRAVLTPALGPRANVREEAIAAWRDVEEKMRAAPARDVDDPKQALERDRLMACRAVLSAEAERLDELPGELQRLRERGHGALVDALEAAYAPAATTHATIDPAALELLGGGWCASVARERAARASGDDATADASAAARATEADRRAARVLAFAWAYVAFFAVGLVLALVWLARDRPEVVSGHAPIPPPWAFEHGFAVLVRSAFFGVVIGLVATWLDSLASIRTVAIWGTLAASAPMLWFFRKHLIAPHAATFASTLGVRGLSRPLAWIAFVLGVFAIEQLGVQAIGAGLARVGVAPHWTERTHEAFFFGGPWRVAAEALDGLAWSPLVEEIGCRGLLFLTLRRIQPPWKAALFSGALFGTLHVESFPGLLGITWSGFVWALAFERARSFLPGLACHVVDNAFLLASLLAFYR